jgi:predicted nucleotidyltransferase
MRAREGDFIKSVDNLIFDVKGLVHPPKRTIAFIRYFPHKKGERKTYEKVYSLSKRYEWLRKNLPQYLVHDPVFDEVLCEVPAEVIKRHYRPIQKLRELHTSKRLDAIESLALELAESLKETANISLNTIGISGSIMVKLHASNSDIDPVIYGSENCWKVYSALQSILKNGDAPFKSYTVEDLKVLFDFRSKDTLMDFDDFVAVESRKVLQGKFRGRDYFIRFVKDWSEISEKYGDVRYKNCGYAKIKATIKDDSESIFTPCTYKVENARIVEGPKLQPIQEIASFRGRFCDQAKTGEVVVAQGKVEHVMDYRQNREHFRLLLGNKPSDYMILA